VTGTSDRPRQRLAGVALNVLDPEGLAPFYTDVLGMTRMGAGGTIRLGYGGAGAVLELRRSLSRDPYVHDRHDTYWKIGITLPDLNLAHDWLRARGIDVSEPEQFGEVGYLCHLADPEGFRIELLQHTFQGQPQTVMGDPAKPLGGGAQIGQITLRTIDMDAERAIYEGHWGMRLLSVQPVEAFGFTLYFFGFTNETPPGDIHSPAIRPWLYQRRYTTLELQHLKDPSIRLRRSQSGATGFAELIFADQP
jgi:catechol-2,3-dioxygenase